MNEDYLKYDGRISEPPYDPSPPDSYFLEEHIEALKAELNVARRLLATRVDASRLDAVTTVLIDLVNQIRKANLLDDHGHQFSKNRAYLEAVNLLDA